MVPTVAPLVLQFQVPWQPCATPQEDSLITILKLTMYCNTALQHKQSPSMLLIALQTVFRSAKHLTPSILSLLLLTRLFQEPEVLHFQEPAICNVTLQVQMG